MSSLCCDSHRATVAVMAGSKFTDARTLPLKLLAHAGDVNIIMKSRRRLRNFVAHFREPGPEERVAEAALGALFFALTPAWLASSSSASSSSSSSSSSWRLALPDAADAEAPEAGGDDDAVFLSG